MESRRGAAEELERTRVTASEVSWALRDLNRATTDLDRALARHMKLRPMDYDALGHLMDADDRPLGTVELAERLRISPGSATELVDRLTKAGHVSRGRSEEDRRRVQVSVTSSAVAHVLGDLGPLFERLDALVDEYEPEEQQVIGDFLRRAAERTREFIASLKADSLL